ncbi:DUF1311 domain-containing protein [Lelliottia sp. V106_10]|uniref:DUF1311 domain-containing protein n=1 Tax=Lelliottia wanjuensis TaxID=3050585 RepID=UPI002550628E|nr:MULTISPECIES: DUF1311 domain-containing protein [unclassified Lelliottia]MDK9355806.1 DUF1311 domain-containing protein [Lelliottia sp. V106_16]MDK9374142.1 DUF1311 domain-containing protein [Lelliottia sp. V106_10]MDK9601939.1 DUF1311 domain-containing protein [Lelliottia sp. V106_5]
MKTKLMIFTTTMLLLHFPLAAKGLYEGEEATQCYKPPVDVHLLNNCFSAAEEKSNRKLDALIHNTSEKIKKTVLGSSNYKDPDAPPLGEVYSQRFLKAQILWKQYKNELCLAVAGEIPEDSLTYYQSLEQCQINLNKRHMEEIEAMGFDSDE